ncbi:MAG: hypothetical protein OEZ51_15260, partial [Nitrospinota bacterium]|nr:hypothetical protein [Nitrospinota bacterium]
MPISRFFTYKFVLPTLLLMAIQGCASHANYPVTRMAGWAPEQHVQWETLELSAEFAGQDFSFYNSTTDLLIKARVRVEGHLTATHTIKKLHISQRTIQEDLQTIIPITITAPGFPPKANTLFIEQYRQKHQTDTIPFTLIEITPVFEADQHHVQAGPAEFDLEIAEPIQNRNWGRNYYRIQLGNRSLDL